VGGGDGAFNINAAWDEAHRMPVGATLDDRVSWHLRHTAACGCREMPKSIAVEIERHGLALPQRGATTIRRVGSGRGARERS
jgi:hypothetical protein